MAKDDLFTWLDALWNKTQPEGIAPIRMMHRFLASDRNLADAARWLQLQVRQPDLVFRTWQGLLPQGRGAPRLSYPAPKKPPQEEVLVARMRTVLGERRQVVEGMIAIVQAAGEEEALYAQFGVEPPTRE
jgi:hypothetical protein